MMKKIFHISHFTIKIKYIYNIKKKYVRFIIFSYDICIIMIYFV